MKTIQVEMPDRMLAAAHEYVSAGFFSSEAEVVRAAVADFARRNRGELLDRFAREDIAWAVRESRTQP